VNAARRARQRANREQAAAPELPPDKVPEFTVQAGLATAMGASPNEEAES
jgi:hypothetical protein